MLAICFVVPSLISVYVTNRQLKPDFRVFLNIAKDELGLSSNWKLKLKYTKINTLYIFGENYAEIPANYHSRTQSLFSLASLFPLLSLFPFSVLIHSMLDLIKYENTEFYSLIIYLKVNEVNQST